MSAPVIAIQLGSSKVIMQENRSINKRLGRKKQNCLCLQIIEIYIELLNISEIYISENLMEICFKKGTNIIREFNKLADENQYKKLNYISIYRRETISNGNFKSHL